MDRDVAEFHPGRTIEAAIHNAVFTPDEFMKASLNFCASVAGIPAVPLEMMLYPRFGSQYLNPVTVVVSTVMFNTMAFFSAANQPAGHHALLSAPVATGALVAAFWAALIAKGIHVWHLMQHMELEADSEVEGKPLPIFRFFPHSDSWGWVRCCWEPLTMFVGSIALYVVGILPIVAAGYFAVSAIALAFKSSITWYSSWKFRRTALDRLVRVPQIQQLASSAQPAAARPTTFVVQPSER